MRVLGVDPGLTRCGLGVVTGTPGRPLRMEAVGVVRTPVAAETAELVFCSPRDLAAAKALYADIKGRMPAFGRAPEHLKILPAALWASPTDSSIGNSVPSLRSPTTMRPIPMIRRSPVSR